MLRLGYGAPDAPNSKFWSCEEGRDTSQKDSVRNALIPKVEQSKTD
jgi:hypothetical protein